MSDEARREARDAWALSKWDDGASLSESFEAGWDKRGEWEASRPVSDDWLERLEIGEDQSDDPHGPFTLDECALGEALFRCTQRDRDCVTGVAGPKFDDDWSKVPVRQRFGWYAAARELLRDAQGAFVAARRGSK